NRPRLVRMVRKEENGVASRSEGTDFVWKPGKSAGLPWQGGQNLGDSPRRRLWPDLKGCRSLRIERFGDEGHDHLFFPVIVEEAGLNTTPHSRGIAVPLHVFPARQGLRRASCTHLATPQTATPEDTAVT